MKIKKSLKELMSKGISYMERSYTRIVDEALWRLNSDPNYRLRLASDSDVCFSANLDDLCSRRNNRKRNIDNEEGQSERDEERYSSWRKYMGGGVGAALGGFYGSMIPPTLLHCSSVTTFLSIKELMGYSSGYHAQGVDEKAFLLNSLLWGVAVGGTTYLLKRHKEKTINESKPQKEEKRGIRGFLKRQRENTRWGVMGSIIALAIGLPMLTSGAAELRKYLTPKAPSGYGQVVTKGRFGEMSCSPLEEKIAYTSDPFTKAGVRTEEANGPIRIFDVQKQEKDILGEAITLNLFLNPISGADPVWGPEGEWIYYTRYENDEPNIYKVRPNGQGNTLVGRGMALSSFSENGKMVKVDAENDIWIDNKETPFEGVEPFLIEGKNWLVYQKLDESKKGVFRGNSKTNKETLLTQKAGWFYGDDIIVPTRGRYRGKIIGLDHNEGVYVINPKTGNETLLKGSSLNHGDLAVSSNGSKLYGGLNYIPRFSDSSQSALYSYKLPDLRKEDRNER